MTIDNLSGAQDNLPSKILVGYWHNFINSAGAIPLSEVPPAYDVINVSFAISGASGGQMQFSPDPAIYPDKQVFKNDIQLLQNNGKKVLISIGGATSPVQLIDTNAVNSFVASMKEIIDTYGFNGMDIDLEGASLSLENGDSDFRSPTSPSITNFIKAVDLLLANYASDFILSAAPETAFVQGGYTTYQGIFGAYLPVIHALRDKLTYVHVQHYNTGSMFGRDGNLYQPATSDFHVAMAEALLAGFSVGRNNQNIFFEPLLPSQVLIGLPATGNAASSGFTEAELIKDAVNYLVKAEAYGGNYVLSKATGYPEFRGLMTWSINWDVSSNNSFSSSYRDFLNSLDLTSGIDETPIVANFQLFPNYPNPFNPSTSIKYEVKSAALLRIEIFDILGKKINILTNAYHTPGQYKVSWNGKNSLGGHVASGIYFYKLSSSESIQVRRMVLNR